MLLSIIIPIYNVQNYIKRCLDSVIECNLTDIELILVNDGSTDKSVEICKKYLENTDITLYHQSNRGLSSARNTGIKYSKGKYIMFMDSDDFIEKVSFEKAIQYLRSQSEKKVDTFINDYYICNKNGEKLQVTTQNKKIHGTSNIVSFLNSKYTIWNVWRCFYRKNFLIENLLYFKEGYLCEDIDFTTNIFLLTTNIVFMHQPFYCYRKNRANSIMNTASYCRIWSLLTQIKDLLPAIKHSSIEQRTRLNLNHRLIKEYILNLPLLYEVSPDKQKDTYLLFRSVIPIISNAHLTPIYYPVIILGIRFYAKVLLNIKKIRNIIIFFNKII